MSAGKLRISLEISTIIEEDGGYYGTGETLERTVALIKRDLGKYRLFIGRGSVEPEEVRARVRLAALTIIDVDGVPSAAVSSE